MLNTREVALLKQSLPSWGAWIEMCEYVGELLACMESLPSWGAWIEIQQMTKG